jgi:hypothetical protein
VSAEIEMSTNAIQGIPRNPLSHHAKSANILPAILVARIVSTRHVEAARNHSKLASKRIVVLKATLEENLRTRKAQKPPEKIINASADGSRALASLTSPAGKDTRLMSQCENGGFDGTAPS